MHRFRSMKDFIAAAGLLGVVLLFLAGCSSEALYEKRIALPDAGWSYEDTLRFDFEIEDTAQLYTLSLEVEHSDEYPFQNLYVRIHTGYPNGESSVQLVSLELAEKTGVWLGKCRGSTCRLRIPIQSKTYFNQPGTYTLALEQYMRRSPLPGLKGFTFRVEPSEPTPHAEPAR